MELSWKIRNLSFLDFLKIFPGFLGFFFYQSVKSVPSIRQSDSLYWATAFFQKVLEIRNLSLCSEIIGHCHFVHNFPPVPEMISKIQSDPSSLGKGIFFYSNGHRKYAIWIYVEKYFNIVILLRISPRFRSSILSEKKAPPGKWMVQMRTVPPENEWFKWEWPRLKNEWFKWERPRLENERDVIENSLRPFSTRLKRFFSNGLKKYAIWVWVAK